ncbi:MAG: CDP-alcohol phosphatidyltransferase family protein [Rhizobiales bacterium]|nr:CDP-alcohol phosphatidyltransferase family protein [Hyphomicrobiales bacterium]
MPSEEQLLERHNVGVFGPLEPAALAWLAPRIPLWMTPDMLTTIGVVGAVMVFFGYALSAYEPHFLWLASLGLAVNWFGDSLDGSLARHRRIERHRYGFYLDNAVDVAQQILTAVGFALSGWIRPDLCYLALASFFAMSILTLLRARAFSTYQVTYAGFGPTELRVAFIILNAVIIFFPPTPFALAGWIVTYADLLSLLWSISMLTTFTILMVRDIARLSAEDPTPPARR